MSTILRTVRHHGANAVSVDGAGAVGGGGGAAAAADHPEPPSSTSSSKALAFMPAPPQQKLKHGEPSSVANASAPPRRKERIFPVKRSAVAPAAVRLLRPLPSWPSRHWASHPLTAPYPPFPSASSNRGGTQSLHAKSSRTRTRDPPPLWPLPTPASCLCQPSAYRGRRSRARS